MRCTSCGSENREEARFCEDCGEALAAPEEACPACGVANSPAARFCIGCGKALTPPAVVAEPAAAAPARSDLAAQGGSVCAACGAHNRPGVRFCENCGQMLVVVEGEVCAACGARNRAGVRFCENCGRPVGVPVAVPRAAPRPLRWVIGALAALVTVAAVGLVVVFFRPDLIPGPVRDITSPPSEAERALALADQFVAAQFPDYVGAERELTPAQDDGHRVFMVTYTRATGGGSRETLLVAVNPAAEEVRTLRSGGS